MKKRLLLTVFAAFAFTLTFAQGTNKISPSVRFLLAGKEGKINVEAPQGLRGKQVQVPSTFDPNAVFDNTTFDNILPFAEPFVVNNVEMAQCWIKMTDKDYNSLERLGVVILSKLNDRVTANVPLDAIEKVAQLRNVTKIDVAKKLKTKTYVTRQLTNVDDVHNYTADAQAAGLLQAYNGQNVVLGVIDTGIDFSHAMFSGRIKKKYVYNTTSEQVEEYTGSSAYFTDETHGTHTSSIAGGSDYTATAYVYTTSTSYTQVNNAKFGGMAPGTDLVLCDLGEELTDANIATCIQNIANYANSVGKPYVISISLGGHGGPHDGTGDMADICAQYTGPGKVIVFAASNDGDEAIYHYQQSASASSPAQSVLTSATRSSYSMDFGAVMSWARTPNVELAARYYVVNTNTNQVLWTSQEITTDDYFVDDDDNIVLYGAEISVNDVGADGTTKLSNYFTAYNSDSENYGYLCCYMDQDPHNNKWYVETILYYLKSSSNNYKIGMSVYPKTGSCDVDSWNLAYVSFTSSNATVNNHSFTGSNPNCTVSNESTFPSVISVGAYCSSVYWRAGTTSASTQSWTNTHTYLDISSFSSYQTEGYGPLGTKLPWITAPGEVIIAAYNSGYTAESNVYYAYGTNKKLGAMSGTSMATPCVAGITALWLQADPTLTPSTIKTIMKNTAIHDSYTDGTNAYKFGSGKIDALEGLAMILQVDGPTIFADPSVVTFNEQYEQGSSYTKTVNVSGLLLTGNITATLNDATGTFGINKSSISQSNALDGEAITITWTPSSIGTYAATLTLSSPGADDVIVNINADAVDGGRASDPYLDIAKYATIDDAGWYTTLVNNLYSYTEYNDQKVGWLTLPVYGAFVGARYATNSSTVGSGHPQAWIECSLGTNNTYAGTTWSGTSPFKGSSTYFTSASARAIGYNSRTNTSIRTVSFYVTNTTEVRLSGTGRSGSSSTYPARLRIYECTKNADGTVTASTTATVNQTSSSTSTFTLNSGDLDATKIYKVETSIYRGYLYEVAFKTPLKTDPEISATPTSINFTANVNKTQTRTVTVTGENLTGDITAAISNDESGVFSLNTQTVSQSGGNANGSVEVSFLPTAMGNYTGTLTLSSPGAQDVTVSLNGVATEPSLTVNPTALTISTPAGISKTGTISFNGENLNGDVSLSLADANGVFSLSDLSLTKSVVENGTDLTVTFNPSEEGTYSATVTVQAEGLEDQTITLNGIATKGWFDLTVSKYGIASLYTDIDLVIPYDDLDLLGVFYGSSYSVDDCELRIKRLGSYETEETAYIPARTAVIVQGNAKTYRFPIATEPVEPLASNVLSGVLVATPVSDIDGTVLTLGMGSNGYVGFYRYSGTTLRANSVYIALTDAEVKAMSVKVDSGDDATGISNIFGNAELQSDDSWYTIQGMKLNGRPTAKGIYIHEGKTVIVR